MEHTPEEEERIKAIQRYLEGEREVDIYRSLEGSKGWVDIKQDAKDGILTCQKEPELYHTKPVNGLSGLLKSSIRRKRS